MIYIVIIAMLQILLVSLPISSSGHIRLFEQIFLCPHLPQGIEYILHGPTIIIIALYFLPAWWPLILHMYRYRSVLYHFFIVGFLADLVTVIMYGIFQSMGMSWFPLSLGFLITMVLLFSLKVVPEGTQSMHWLKALCIGAVQGIALLPGISRFGATYVVGCWLGLPRRRSFAFSCAIAWPLLVAGFAQGWRSYSYSLCFSLSFSSVVLVLVGVASIGAYMLLCYCYYLATTKRLWLVGWYMLLPLLCSLWIASPYADRIERHYKKGVHE